MQRALLIAILATLTLAGCAGTRTRVTATLTREPIVSVEFESL